MHLRARYGHGGRARLRARVARRAGALGRRRADRPGHAPARPQHWLAGPLPLHSALLRTHFWDTPVEDNAALLLGEADSRTDPWAMLHVSWTEWKNLFSLEVYCRTAKIQVDGLVRSYGPQRLTIYRMRPELGPPELEEIAYPDEDRSWEREWAELRRGDRGRRRAACCSATSATRATRGSRSRRPTPAVRTRTCARRRRLELPVGIGSRPGMPDVQRSQRRRIGVLGLWHLGSVIAAGLAACRLRGDRPWTPTGSSSRGSPPGVRR